MQKVQQERSNFYHVVETTANDFVMKGKDWLGNLETARSSLLQAATVSLEKSTGRLQEASKTSSALEGDVASHVTASQAAWQELYSAQENDLRKHSDHLNAGLRNHAHLTSESLTALHAAAHTQESLLEEQRADMSTMVRERKDDFEAQTTALNDWANLLGTEIKQRNEDVVKLLTEELRHDIPTGHTPQKREFVYPRFLASTSPHQRIVERYRQEHPDSPTSDADDDAEAEFSELSRRSAGAAPSSDPFVSANSVHRSVSMGDLAAGAAAGAGVDGATPHSGGGGRLSGTSGFVKRENHPLHKALSVESVAKTKDNKENFVVPQAPAAGSQTQAPPASSQAQGAKRETNTKSNAPTAGGRKILINQNTKP